jgi:hypothetical protein
MHLIENGVSEQTANRIQTLLDKDGPFEEIITHLKGFTKAKSEVRNDGFKSIGNLLFVLGIKIIERYCGSIRNYC